MDVVNKILFLIIIAIIYGIILIGVKKKLRGYKYHTEK